MQWKYEALAEFVATPPRLRQGNGTRTACRFVTRSLPALTPYYRLFYKDGRKRVPEVVLSPLTRAVWFMDDGCRSRNAVYLNTQQFSIEEQQRLLRMLKTQYGIDGTLNRDRCYRRIRLRVDSTAALVGLIEPFVLPELKYKLPHVTP